MSERNYHRFYALLAQMPDGRSDDVKETIVSSFTDGRTVHLREMTDEEYADMCVSLEMQTSSKRLLRKRRSVCLRLMQQLGVDTTDWTRINAFCQDQRIAGRVFAKLSVADLDALQVKLRAIMSKGGLRSMKSPSPGIQPRAEYMIVQIGNGGEA